MFSTVTSAAVIGIEALEVHVEADVSDGLPIFQMVGLLSSEVREAKDRVRTALHNSHIFLPPKHITVNLSPADIRKEGTAFDLPVALAVLAAARVIPGDTLKDYLIAGELSLDGKVNRIRGVLPIICLAKDLGMKACIVPKGNAYEGTLIKDIKVYGVDSLQEVIEFFLGVRVLREEYAPDGVLFEPSECDVDFSQINGQTYARRAIEVAVAGMHNILIAGPPGAGKTMLARAIPGIMPLLSFEESLELSKIYSVSGELSKDYFFVDKRPFRDPHHTSTAISLTGGGASAKPGELSLASSGVLFLDELPEFPRSTLEILRQPLEERKITVTRLNHTCTYPANFMLVAAMNPCKCGFYPDRRKCNCTREQVDKYIGRISRPLLDRFDICIDVKQISSSDLFSKQQNESSASIRSRILEARAIQLERYKDMNLHFNSELSSADIDIYCALSDSEKTMLRNAFDRFGLSARGCSRVLKTARTIADLAGSKQILPAHLQEAICYRNSRLTCDTYEYNMDCSTLERRKLNA